MSNETYRRNLKASNVDRFIEELKVTSFDFLNEVFDDVNMYFFFKRVLLNIMN